MYLCIEIERTCAGDQLVERQTIASWIADASCGRERTRMSEVRQHHRQTRGAAFDGIELVHDGDSTTPAPRWEPTAPVDQPRVDE